MWRGIKTWSYLELLSSTKRAKCSSYNVFFHNLSLYQNKRAAVIELRKENKQNVISYSQLRKSKISLVTKFQTTVIYLFSTFYLKSNYI